MEVLNGLPLAKMEGFSVTATGDRAAVTSVLLMLMFIATGRPVLANPYSVYRSSGQAALVESSSINCEKVRLYVGQIGLSQAEVLARAAGMTATQEWRATRCLAKTY
jgi:hypothetical protein